jgi:hypothetical protein
MKRNPKPKKKEQTPKKKKKNFFYCLGPCMVACKVEVFLSAKGQAPSSSLIPEVARRQDDDA